MGIFLPFGSQRRTIAGFHLDGQLVGKCENLPPGIAGGDHEDFGDLYQLRHIEQRDVLGLLVIEDVGNLSGGSIAFDFRCDGIYPWVARSDPTMIVRSTTPLGCLCSRNTSPLPSKRWTATAAPWWADPCAMNLLSV